MVHYKKEGIIMKRKIILVTAAGLLLGGGSVYAANEGFKLISKTKNEMIFEDHKGSQIKVNGDHSKLDGDEVHIEMDPEYTGESYELFLEEYEE